MKRQDIAIWLCFVQLTLLACGYKTAPSPPEKSSSIEQFQARQQGEKILLTWNFSQDVPTQGFIVIKTFEFARYCIKCDATLISSVQVPLPSHHLIIEESRAFLMLDLPKTLSSYLFELKHQDINKTRTFATVLTRLQHFSEFPSLPEVKLVLNSSSAVLMRWQAPLEKMLFKLGTDQPENVYYQMNIYRKAPSDKWTRQPIHNQPISDEFFLDQEIMQTALYQFRLVDSYGNESSPSQTYTITRP